MQFCCPARKDDRCSSAGSANIKTSRCRGESTTMKSGSVFFLTVAVIAVSLDATAAWGQTRWSEQKANSWYAQQSWLVGSNYVPKSAINQLEMWQEATFDPTQIDTELSWAEALGMNTMRVFLHDLLWQQDAAGFTKSIDRLSTIAS